MLAAIESNNNQGGGGTSLNSEKTSIASVCPPYGAPNLANPGLTILALGVMPQLAMPSSLTWPGDFLFDREAQLGGKRWHAAVAA